MAKRRIQARDYWTGRRPLPLWSEAGSDAGQGRPAVCQTQGEMDRNSVPVRLSAERHYESLRDAVWLRLVAEDPRMPWASFEDTYQEAWAWVATQESDVLVDSGSPVAYLAQVVRRRYVDELRSRRRGIGRNGKAPVVE